MKEQVRRRYGRSAVELPAEVEGAPPSLGLGDVVALAALAGGETVLDLGSGPGRDLFAAARAVGPRGRAIGVDMTPEMLERSRAAARDGGMTNVAIVDGDLERLPIACGAVDVVISNCVINLVDDKRRALVEAYRVLRPGGRLAVLDTAFESEPGSDARADTESWSCCVGGALVRDEYEAILHDIGFEDAGVEPVGDGCSAGPLSALAVTVTARKPGDAPEGVWMRPAVPADLPAIEAMLRDAELPLGGLRIEDTTVALDGGEVVGAVAVERYASTALLRSLVVRPDRRKTGIGRRLTGAALDVARWSGAQVVYALTAAAQGFFERFHFEPVSRARGRSECPSPQMGAPECDGAATLCLSFEDADLPLLGRPSRKPLPTFEGGTCC